jgi:tetratricopeptide (TPR) repeat protein
MQSRRSSRSAGRCRNIIRASKDPHLLLTYEGTLGNLAAQRGDFSLAERHYRLALRYARRSTDQEAEVTALQNLGAVSVDQSLLSEAIRWYRRALRKAMNIGSPPRLLAVHTGLAVALHRSSRHREASGHFEDARRFAVELGERDSWAALTADIGALAINLGETERAISLLTEALAAFKESGNREWEGFTRRNLVEAYFAIDKIEEVKLSAEEALRVLPIDAHPERAHVMRRAAEASLGDPSLGQQAADYFQRALIEQRSITEPIDRAWQAAQVGATVAASGASASALPFFSLALESFQLPDDRRGAFLVLNDRANALASLERFDDARRDYRECEALAAALGDRALQFQTLLNSGEVERRAGAIDEAIRRLQEAVDVGRELGDEKAVGEGLGNLGLALSNANKWDEAKTAFQSAQRIARQLRYRPTEAVAVGGLAGVALATEQYSDARRLYRRAVALEEAANDYAHVVEDLAGLTEVLAALGDMEEMQTQGQRLIDLAQSVGKPQIASHAFNRSAYRCLQRGDLENAAGLYTAAVASAMVDPDSDRGPNGVVMTLALMVYQVRQELQHMDEMEFLESVFCTMSEQHPEIVDLLPTFREAVATAQEAMQSGET